MKFETTLIGLICVALCAVPFILMNRSRKKREKQLIQALNILAVQEHGEISEHEIGTDYLIAIDKSRGLLFYQSNSSIELEQVTVDLSKIKSCNISQKSSKGSTGKVIEKLDLIFIPKDAQKPKIALEFYNRDVNYNLSGQLQSIQKWESLVKEQLK